jgi:hypothetical protein
MQRRGIGLQLLVPARACETRYDPRPTTTTTDDPTTDDRRPTTDDDDDRRRPRWRTAQRSTISRALW